jgi:ribose transport system permease protein
LPPSAGVAAARRPRWAHALQQNAGLVLAAGMLLAAVVLYAAVYYAGQGRMPGGFELTTTVNNTMPLVFAAVAQTCVVLTRGLDLSVGGVVDLSNALAAVLLGDSLASMVGWSAAIVGVGALCGLVNGVLVAYGRLQPILVTLATLSIYQGVAIRVLPQPGGAVPPAYTDALVNTAQPVALLYAVLVVALWGAFRRTRLGVGLYAVGNDEAAAQANGVPARRTKVAAYALGGALSAVAGLFLAATSTAGDATTGNSYTLTSIVAVVLGGVNLFGGRGSAAGAVIGAFVTTMIVNVLFFARIDPLYQNFYEGLFLVVAVVAAGALGRLLRGRG